MLNWLATIIYTVKHIKVWVLRRCNLSGLALTQWLLGHTAVFIYLTALA